MNVAVLALQGAFAEMETYWRTLGAETFEIRQPADLEREIDLLALPGGESTVQGRLLKTLGLFEPLKKRIDAGLPVFATCAGLILLAQRIEDEDTVWFASLPVTVKRNAYGRQLGSFTTRGAYDGSPDTAMTFIRAPAITAVGDDVKVLSSFEGRPTAVRWRNITALAWHPELTPHGGAR